MTVTEAVKKLRAMAAAIEKLPADAIILNVEVNENPKYDGVHLSAFGGLPEAYEDRELPHCVGKVYREKRVLVDSVPVFWDVDIVEVAQ